MSLIFYVISSFPAMAINLGLGNIPSRYLSFIFVFQSLKFNRKDLWLFVVPFFALLYPLLSLPFRPFHLLDISYVLAFFYLILGVTIVRKNPSLFKNFVFYFWLVNIIYAVFQNVIINIIGDSLIALIHENTHKDGYVIPQVAYLPYLYRVTGLFVESAPFVIYLMFTHFAFVVMGFRKCWIRVNLFFIFLAGSKIGLFFLLILLLLKFPLVRRINFLYLLILMLFLVVLLSPIILTFIVDNRNLSLGSLYSRLSGLLSTVDAFTNSWASFFMGSGYISSTEIMSGIELEFKRGIDFFSTFIVSNGVFGSFFILFPFYMWFKKNKSFPANLDNLYFSVLFLALLTMGGLVNFQYAYLVFILTYLSQRKFKKVEK